MKYLCDNRFNIFVQPLIFIGAIRMKSLGVLDSYKLLYLVFVEYRVE